MSNSIIYFTLFIKYNINALKFSQSPGIETPSRLTIGPRRLFTLS